MQSMEIDGLKEIIQTLETTPEVIRQARAEFFDEAGEVLLEASSAAHRWERPCCRRTGVIRR